MISKNPERYLQNPRMWPELKENLATWRQSIRNSKAHRDPVASADEARAIRKKSWQLLMMAGRAFGAQKS